MKYFLLVVLIIIGSGLTFGKLADDFVDESRKTRLEKYCEQLKTWHPDCKIE